MLLGELVDGFWLDGCKIVVGETDVGIEVSGNDDVPEVRISR